LKTVSGSLSKSNGCSSGGFEKGINPEVSNGIEGSLLKSNFLTTVFTGLASGQLRFIGSVKCSALVTGRGRSISSGKGIDVLLLLHDTARNKNAHKKM
jgi:hypothetical protein